MDIKEIPYGEYAIAQAAKFLEDAGAIKYIQVGVLETGQILMFTNLRDEGLKGILDDLFRGVTNYGGIDKHGGKC